MSIEQTPASRIPAFFHPRNRASARSWIIYLAALLFAIALVNGSVFSIDQTELGNVRRFGTVLYPRNEPLEPGLHFKVPFIDTADTVRVTLQTLHIPAFDVLTVDNQRVSIEENFNYNIGKSQAYHVMYEVGRSGSVDIDDQVIPVARDRTARVFAAQNMVAVNANREAIQDQVEKSVTKAVEDLFGISAHSLQISAIRPSENFMASIDQATMAKNSAIAAENQLRTKQFEAEQVAATAKGAADAAIEQARGEAEATRLNAEAHKAQLELEGEGLAANLENQIKPFGSPERYIQYMNAKALLNWNGQQPQIVTGNGSGTSLVVPLPALKAAGASDK
jgi:regulator of protease activity HflC (stomatin/prohibitin superfamily)